MALNFKKDLYPKGITYTSHNSPFVFLDSQENVKSFFKFFAKELIKAENSGEILVIENDSDRMALIDVSYNFFIEKFAEWCQNYSTNKEIMTEYNRYKNTTIKNDDGTKDTIRMVKHLKINMSIKERVQFDYDYSSWMVANPFHKRIRFNLVQTFFNSFIGKMTYVLNYSKPMYAQPVTRILGKNIVGNEYFLLGAISFHRGFLVDQIGKNTMDKLKKIAKQREVIITTKPAIEKRIKALKIEEKVRDYYSSFDILKVEESRNELDGKWEVFVPKIEEENDEDEE